MSINQPISEKEWQARYDAESLAKAEEIKADPNRHNAAMTAATKIAEEKRKELNGINRVANKAKASKTPQKSTATPVISPRKKPKTVKRQSNGGSKGSNNNFNVFQKI